MGEVGVEEFILMSGLRTEAMQATQVTHGSGSKVQGKECVGEDMVQHDTE